MIHDLLNDRQIDAGAKGFGAECLVQTERANHCPK